MKAGSWLALVVVGIAGCGAQLAPTGPDQNGSGGTGGTRGAGKDAGCPSPPEMACVSTGCYSNDVSSPVCIDGAWTCPASTVPAAECPTQLCDIQLLVDGCTCNPATGAITCTQDAGPDATSGDGCIPTDGGGPDFNCSPRRCAAALPFGCSCDPVSGEITCSSDAGADMSAGCPPRQDGSIVQCVTACNNDGALEAICSAGAWVCPQGSFDVSTCPDFNPPSG